MPAGRPSITDYPVLAEAVFMAVDELRELHATLIAANSRDGKRPRVRRTPRPETAAERLERQRSAAVLADLERRLQPRP